MPGTMAWAMVAGILVGAIWIASSRAPAPRPVRGVARPARAPDLARDGQRVLRAGLSPGRPFRRLHPDDDHVRKDASASSRMMGGAAGDAPGAGYASSPEPRRLMNIMVLAGECSCDSRDGGLAAPVQPLPGSIAAASSHTGYPHAERGTLRGFPQRSRDPRRLPGGRGPAWATRSGLVGATTPSPSSGSAFRDSVAHPHPSCGTIQANP